MSSLWGDEFSVSKDVEKSKKIIKKVQQPIVPKTKKVSSSKLNIQSRLASIELEVRRILGSYTSDTRVIYTVDEFRDYIDSCIQNGIVALDTETNNSLDPLTCKLMGLCLYTENQKNLYVPVNHEDLNSRQRLENQLTEQQIATELNRLVSSNVKIIMHNGKFDYKVIKCTCGVELPIYWDTLIGARILDENERAGLKEQYISKLDPSIEHYSIEHLFEKLEYAIVDPAIFALYAATDAFMTYRLYEFQLKEFSKESNARLFSLFMSVEMPIVIVAADMELTGICLDLEYSKRLSAKYNKLLTDCDNRIQIELSKFKSKIDAWKLTSEANYTPPKKTGDGVGKSKAQQLEDPLNIGSPTQLAILFYDILKVEQIDKKSPRGTGEEILQKISDKYPELTICKLILEKRGLYKLINTYIDKLPTCLSEKDGRLHAEFNQLGAATGRFSSSSPNLQNIPSHNNEIRMMFTAQEGYILCGSDFSQQEPRLLANYAQDENMITAYKEGKDLYATIASSVYHNKYEDNKEFYPDGTMNPEGKKRRSNCKSLLLGLMYGRGVASIADQIKTHKGPTTKEDIQEAQKITDGFFNEFPKVKNWIDTTQTDAKKNGYVEDCWGRRRRLPDIQLEKFEISFEDGKSQSTFNPLLGSKGVYCNSNIKLLNKYRSKCNQCRNKKDLDAVKAEALKYGIKIKDNGGYISQAERQCVNARVQGGAASMSKRAMIAVHSDKQLKELGFKLLIAVHDELIGECPIQNQEEVKKRLSYLMIESAKPECTVPMKCDADSFKSWYYDVYTSNIKEEFEKLLKSKSKEESLNIIYKEHEEMTKEQLDFILIRGDK